MSDENLTSLEDLFPWLLAACDDTPAADVPSLLANAAALPPDIRDRLEEDAQWCRKLRRLLRAPGTTLSQPSDVETACDFFSPAITPGASFGRFRVIRELGRGSFGVVFLAFDPGLGREVALKVPRPDVQVSPDLRARFRQEARAAAGLDHPNLVPVYEVGEEGLVCFIASGYCPGITLAAWLKQRTEPIPYQQAAHLMATLADAVAHAHERGVIHRDLKPGNILLQKDGEARTDDEANETPTIESHALSKLLDPASSLGFQPKITDFGLAKLVEGHGSAAVGRTQTGAIVGTPSYMAPEQAEAKKEIGPAADIYALGAILYELIAGRPPFVADSTLEVLFLVRNEEPLTPSRLRSKLPRDLETICLKCLHKEPTRRYASARNLAGDLRRFLTGEPIQARPVGTVERLMKWTRRRPAVAALVASLVAAFLGTVIGLVLLNDAWEKEAAARQTAEQQKEEARYNQYVAEMNLVQREYEANNLGHVRELLAAQVPKEPGTADRRGVEWYYWQRMTHRELLILEGHRDRVRQVAFSPDGKRFGSASDDGTVRIWDAATGQELLNLKGHTDNVWHVQFSPDGRLLASASRDRTVRLWDASSGQELRALKGHTNYVSCVSFSPDSRRLASVGSGGTARLWDTTTGQELFTFKVPWQFNNGTLSPDGRRLVIIGVHPTVLVLDVATGKELLSLMGHKDTVQGVSYSPDGRLLATASADQTVRVWDSATGKVLLTLKGHTGLVWAVVFSPDGRQLASASADQTVRLWDAVTGQELLILKGHTSAVSGVSFSPDGRRLVSAGNDKTVRIWDAVARQDTLTLTGHDNGVRSVTLSPDGGLLASAGNDRTVRIWNAVTGLRKLTLTGHKDLVRGLSFSPDGRRLASSSPEGIARVWDVTSGQELRSIQQRNPSRSSDLVFSPDGQRLAFVEQEKLRVTDSTDGKELLTLRGHTALVYCVAFSPDGRWLASGGQDQTVRLWDAATGQELLTLKGHTGAVLDVFFDRDGCRLASASGDQTVCLWDTTTGQQLLTLKGHVDEVSGVSFSPDGRRLASSSADHTVRLWDPVTGKDLLALKGHTREVSGVVFSPVGRRLASASNDGTVRVWEIDAMPDEVWKQRELASHVNSLFEKHLFRTDVLDTLRQDTSLAQADRKLALEMAQDCREDPYALNKASWNVVKAPGAGKDAYALALRQAEAGARQAPNDGLLLNTLGIAQYRACHYVEALQTMTRSAHFNSNREGPMPEDLAFLAMTQHQLGKNDEAKATLQRLQEMKKQPHWETDPDSTGFLREAEQLIEGKSASKGQ